MEKKRTKRTIWLPFVDEGVPLRKNEANHFAWRLRRYLEDRVMGLCVESISFVMHEGFPVLQAYVKKERRRAGITTTEEGKMVEVFEGIGGPEIRLFVNDFHIATWMTGCDRFTTEMLDENFEEFAQVSMLAILGTWDLHNVTICCSRWGEKKGKTIECCTAPA
jgi:hypothetical protein